MRDSESVNTIKVLVVELYPVIMDVQETTFRRGISSNSCRASFSWPHFEYISISADETKRSVSKPKTKACWWVCLPATRSHKAEQDLMAQGKLDRLGLRASFRMEEKARRASTESPPRAKSAITEFHEWTLDLSTYLLNHVARLGLLEYRRQQSFKGNNNSIEE